MIAAVILAAGESRRMGSPKALVPYRGLTFLEHLLAATRHPRIGLTRVVLGRDADQIRSQLRLAPSQILINESWENGPLSSFQVALRSLQSIEAEKSPTEKTENQIEAAVLCLVDHPLITIHLVSQLISAFDQSSKSIILPTYRGQRGHPVIFRKNLFTELLEAPLDVGARAVVHAHASDVAEVPTEEEGVLLNLNDPEALRLLRG
jgi:molybdenum cofactor cytidylyltransferase